MPHFSIQEKELTTTEKARYIKQYLYMTESPCGGNYTEEQIDKMVYLIKHDWKESGGHHYEWINTVYSDVVKQKQNYENKRGNQESGC